MVSILIPISFFGTIFGVLYMHYTTRHKERIALIEKGIDASVFYPNEKVKSKFYSLQFGTLGVCIRYFVWKFAASHRFKTRSCQQLNDIFDGRAWFNCLPYHQFEASKK